MAFSKKGNKAAEKKSVEFGKVESFEILKATNFSWGCAFNMILNGVTIYNCTVAESKDGKFFISFPSRKGTDDKWYSYIYFRFSDEDMERILAAVSEKLG